ncbi:hypothetical protein M2262_003197 [Pseudomonas sp. BIGb0408]|uniref:DUF2846 domain-containing protein n=1 Tax=Phytopseudomonas flavescens TaxID=29435 RepID=A0A7Y9XJA4_9GAMM|nr:MULTISPECIES: hypothetical protein [Pseudomonas]MCW2293147.1 hypothetical protein [Pseudomonas sp. BIGb0408]NYH72282.1 hypothetical protein [Pseudomonas flavescens]
MKVWMIAAAVVLLSACTSTLPAPIDSKSVVLFSRDSTHTLVASKLNGERVESGRYFSVLSGHNRLEVLVVGESGKNYTFNRFVLIDYDNFSKASTYKISVADRGVTKALQLIDENGVLLGESSF